MEIDYLKDDSNIERFKALLESQTNTTYTLDEAQTILTKEAFRQVDLLWFLSLQKDRPAEQNTAKAFLAQESSMGGKCDSCFKTFFGAYFRPADNIASQNKR